MNQAGETVGERLRRLRQEQGLTQRDVAGNGVSYSYVSRVETGQRTASVSALRTLAERLGVSAAYLETGVEPAEGDAGILDAELELRLGSAQAARDGFDKALENARTAGDRELEARARLGLGLAAASLGESDVAISELEAALAEVRPRVAERPDVYSVLARCYSNDGQSVRALALLTECVEEVLGEELVDSALYVRFATYRAYALMDTGDIVAANRSLADALGHAEQVDDAYTQIRLYWSLGRLYAVQGPPHLATTYTRKAIALLEQTEDRIHLGSAHEACATTLLDQGMPAEALPHLDAAEAIYVELGQPALRASLTVQRARHALQGERPDEARRYALEALDLLEAGSADAENVGDAWRVLAETLAALGDADLAGSAFARALDQLEHDGAPVKTLADAHRAHADFLEGQGRTAEALAAMRAAADLTAGAGRASTVRP